MKTPAQGRLAQTLSLFDEALALLEEQAAPLQVSGQLPADPLPSLLEQCERLVEQGGDDRGPRFLIGMPGVPPLEPVWWRAVISGVQCLPLPRFDDLGRARISSETVHALHQDARRLGRDLLLLASLDQVLPEALRSEQGLLLVCHPLTAYPAAGEDPGLGGRSFEQFCADVLAGLAQYEGLARLRWEDIEKAPEQTLREHFGFKPSLVAEHVSDDGLNAMSRRCRSAEDLEAPAYLTLCAALGYESSGPAGDRPEASRAEKLAAPGQVSGLELPRRPMVIACHHKAGTNVLRNIFTDIAKTMELRLWKKFYDPEPEFGAWDICFHQHSRVLDVLIPVNDFRGLHGIRHPMSLVYSAVLYHEKCSEPWVDVPLHAFTSGTFAALSDRDVYNEIKKPETSVQRRQELMRVAKPVTAGQEAFVSGYEFGGRSYRQILNSLGSIEEKLIFEMQCFSHGAIMDMIFFPGDQRFQKITLEEISHDTSMAGLLRLFRHLGFKGRALDTCMALAAPHCLWNKKELPSHATSGVSQDWMGCWGDDVLRQFRDLFGYAEVALGYPGYQPALSVL